MSSRVHFVLDVSTGPITVNVEEQLKFGNQMQMEMIGGCDPKLVCFYTNGVWTEIGTDIEFFGIVTAPRGYI